MADVQPAVLVRKRNRGAEATARADALQRLKALRRCGRRSENGESGGIYSIKLETPIYDSVPEEEYNNLVARRREEAQGFIVDDDGLGYGDEGQEEDWSQAGFPPSSDESDGEDESRKRFRRKRSAKKGKEIDVKKVNASLTAAGAMIGSTKISSMFTSNVFNHRDSGIKVKSSDCEKIVDDVIAEFAPDEGDRERRKRGQLGAANLSPIKSEKKVFYGCNKDFNFIVKADLDRDFSNYIDCTGNGGEKDEENVEAKEGKLGEDNLCVLVKEEVGSAVKVKAEEVVVKEEVRRTLNAKIIKEDRDPALSAAAGWKEVRSGGNVVGGSCGGVAEEVKTGAIGAEQLEFEVDDDGSLPFYIIDAHEEIFGANVGTVYLFGKVKAGNTYHSCCVVVKNMQRRVYAIPNSSISDEMMRLKEESTDFHRKLQDMAYELKNEIANKLLTLNVSSFSMAPVKRKYAFEHSDIPLGESYVLQINYPFKEPPLPADLKGETFYALLGTHYSALELLIIEQKIRGPSWLSISKFATSPASPKVSWCKFEIIVDSPKDISLPNTYHSVPPVVVSAINLKTVINEKENVNEIVSASVICCHKAKIDSPMLASEWKKPGVLSHFTIIRKLDGGIFPMGFSEEVTNGNTLAGSNVLVVESSERALISRLMIALQNLDSDVLVGHNISGFDLDVLLRRAQACRVPSSTWSKIGRLKRSVMPKLTKENAIFGSGASLGIMSCIAGRLLCDTYLSSRDLLKEVSYSLTQLAKSQLNKDRKEVAPHDIPTMFQKSKSLIELVEYGETDARLSMELMFHLNVLPLTHYLTNISGNLWGKTLQGARAQRVEYLLLHEFHKNKYIVPNKISSHAKEAKMTKLTMNGIEDRDRNADELDAYAAKFDIDNLWGDHGRGKKVPSYAGGLVLEPKKGLYDKYILLLDFNSLYPSIIQEYNICFTTVERSMDGLVPRLPSSIEPGILPQLLKKLVADRRNVKTRMKNASGINLQQLDIEQQALKLTANSIYGCLGFSNSRFYAKHLAELITLQGREILQSTVDLVQNNLNLEVIYGDTDSIMIYSGKDDIAEAQRISWKVIEEVNKKYRCLEIDLDGLYKRMLLLKKKKYAAVKVQFKGGKAFEIIERKGLDMVRRDWSLLSKEMGDICLAQILSGKSCEDVVESIHNSLMKVKEDMRSGLVGLEKYVITKTLTKAPEAYSDAKNQPHALVALRLKQSGYTNGCSAGDTVPYIICCEQGVGKGSSTGIAQRARHPDELKNGDGKWIVDIDYYLAQQIHPIVSRLCASIQGTSPERLADCLGLDSSKFQSKPSDVVNSNPPGSLLFAVNDEERFGGCEPLILSCPSCSGTFECPAVFSSICTSISEKSTNPQAQESTSNFWHGLRCPRCPKEGDVGRISPAMIANEVKKQAEGFVSTYYKGVMMCDDETCRHTTRSLNMRLVGDSERGTVCPNYPRCSGRLVRKYTEADLYKQLTYFCHLLDTVYRMEKLQMDAGTRIPLERELKKIRPMVDLAVSTVQKIRDRCAYGWIQLTDLAVSV